MSTVFGIEVVSLPELAVTLGVTTRAIQKWVANGRFPPPVSVGRARLWRADEVREWLEARFASVASRGGAQ